MDNKFWKGISLKYDTKWRAIFDSNREGADLSNNCPICNQKTLHRYYQIGKLINKVIGENRYIAKGSEWQWCSSCRHFEHSETVVPDWWKCDLEIDGRKLTAIPETIDVAYKNPEKINRWNAVPNDHIDKWVYIFSKNCDKINLDLECPVCNKKTLHQYYTIAKDEKVKYKKKLYKGQGSHWQWCSYCFHYEHDYWTYIPLDWCCSIEVESWKLMSVPEPINEVFEQTAKELIVE